MSGLGNARSEQALPTNYRAPKFSPIAMCIFYIVIPFQGDRAETRRKRSKSLY
jgi:hypothetical protein